MLSGVSVDKYQVAKQTILDEFDKFKNGNFSEEKLALAKRLLHPSAMNRWIDQKVLSK